MSAARELPANAEGWARYGSQDEAMADLRRGGRESQSGEPVTDRFFVDAYSGADDESARTDTLFLWR